MSTFDFKTATPTASIASTGFFFGADSQSDSNPKIYNATALPLFVGTTSISGGTTTRILYDNAGVVGEYTLSGSGTAVAMATSPSLTTPTLGVATATSINKMAITAPATSSTLAVADGKTFTVSNTLTLAGTDGKSLTLTNGLTVTTNDGTLAFGAASKTLTVNNSLTLAGTDSTIMTFPSVSASVGYINVPLNSQSAPYTTVLADSGYAIFHPASDANARTFTIDSNANVAYGTGTTLTFINMSANNVTIAITSDTMNLAGPGTTGSRTLAQYGVATAVKLASTTWIISGTNLT